MELDTMPEQQDGEPNVTTTTDLPLIEAEIVESPTTLDGTTTESLDASVATSFQALAMAGSRDEPAVTKQFKCTETFMAPSGVMMERDVFNIVPTSALTLPNPDAYSLGLTYGEAKPKGKLFTGQNRKARRAAEKKQMQNVKKKAKSK